MENEDQNPLIRLRPETRTKFSSIAKFKRWTLTETADALADEFIKRHNVPELDKSATRHTARRE